MACLITVLCRQTLFIRTLLHSRRLYMVSTCAEVPKKMLGRMTLIYMKPIWDIAGTPTGKPGEVASDTMVLTQAGMPSFCEALSLARLAYLGRVAKSAPGFLRCTLDAQPDWANEVRQGCAGTTALTATCSRSRETSQPGLPSQRSQARPGNPSSSGPASPPSPNAHAPERPFRTSLRKLH